MNVIPGDFAALRAEAERELARVLGERAATFHPLQLDDAASAIAGARDMLTTDAPGVRPFRWVRRAVRALRRLEISRDVRRRLIRGARH